MRPDRRHLRRLAGALGGAAILLAGVLAVFLTSNPAGSASLVTLGALVIGVALFSERIESLEFGGARMQLRDLAKQRFSLARQAEREGDAVAASRLRRQAHGFQRLAGTYARIRRSTAGGPSRTRILDEVVAQASRLAAETEFDPPDVWSWFDEGDEGARVIALGLMQGDERLRDFFCALDGIESSRSAFERYHALVVARQMAGGLTDLERDWLAAAVTDAQRSKRFREDGPSMAVANSILVELGR